MSKSRKIMVIAAMLGALVFVQGFTSATTTASAAPEGTWSAAALSAWNTYVQDVGQLLYLSVKAYGATPTNNVVVAAYNNALATGALNGNTFISFYDGFDAALKNAYNTTANAGVNAQFQKTYTDFKAWRALYMAAFPTYPAAY